MKILRKNRPVLNLTGLVSRCALRSPNSMVRTPVVTPQAITPPIVSPMSVFSPTLVSSRDPSTVVPGLLVGNQYHASKESLARNSITHVVDCCCLTSMRVAGVQYLELELDDHVDFPISKHFKKAIRFISDAIDNGGRVLVHCQMGQSRSVTIVTAYLMSRFPEFRDYQDALDYICSCHSPADPNFSFIDQLKTWQPLI